MRIITDRRSTFVMDKTSVKSRKLRYLCMVSYFETLFFCRIRARVIRSFIFLFFLPTSEQVNLITIATIPPWPQGLALYLARSLSIQGIGPGLTQGLSTPITQALSRCRKQTFWSHLEPVFMCVTARHSQRWRSSRMRARILHHCIMNKIFIKSYFSCIKHETFLSPHSIFSSSL